MGVKPVVVIDSPTPGSTRGRPFAASGTVVPPDGVGTAGSIFLRNSVTRELLATCVAPAGGGAWSAQITGAVMAMLAGTATPRQIAMVRRAGIVLTKANANARRAGGAQVSALVETTARA